MKFVIPMAMNDRKCCFEEYDRNEKRMKSCGRPAVVCAKKGSMLMGLCLEHASVCIDEKAECTQEAMRKIGGKIYNEYLSPGEMMRYIRMKARQNE